MSSPDCEKLISTMDRSLPIAELIKLIEHSFHGCEFNEIENILIDWEENMKVEMENLVRDRDSIKEEVRLLERTQDLAVLQKMKLEEKLQRSRMKCEELNETITRLMEQQRVYIDRGNRAAERCEKINEENIKISKEKNKLILDLNEKINELKNKNLESERLVAMCEHKIKFFDARLVKLAQEIECFRTEKLTADQTMKDLRQRLLEADQVAEDLKRQNIELTQTVDDLRLKKLESESRLENLTPRIKKVEEALAHMLSVKVEDLVTFLDGIEGVAAKDERGNGDFPNSEGVKDDLENDSSQDEGDDDAVNMGVRARSTCNSTGSGCIGLSKRGSCRKQVQSCRVKEDGSNTVQTSPGSQYGYNSPPTESSGDDHENEREGLRRSGPHAGFMCPSVEAPVRGELGGTGSPSKMACSSSAAGNIIVLCDSDDENPPDETACTPDRGANVGENEMTFDKFVRTPSSSQRNQRNRTDFSEDSLVNLSRKRKRSIARSDKVNIPINQKKNQILEPTNDGIGPLENNFLVKPTPSPISHSVSRSHEEKSGLVCDSQTPLQKFNALKDGDTTDSEDESCSDSCMDELIATLESEKLSRKWMFKADMLQAFQDDVELCMNAVCALYRQQFFTGKSTHGSSKYGVFSHIDSISGRVLAEYLIDGDPELRLKKSVSDVKEGRPDVLSKCRKLANIYHEKLFEIYCDRKDPFFGET
ncbi:uncharacterized protein LOC105158540 isoform X1 [Sesamum indicum]|uniref:Uncharacterized protein LOC105158540 isoform X1 n=1 Tax=Sesamum indicum TaxID=4182 RepID=A0A6I9SSW0_SESIN|nr:uncharacterized protein LOC105158540 isoform X1 [Sesamum indicum]